VRGREVIMGQVGGSGERGGGMKVLITCQ